MAALDLVVAPALSCGQLLGLQSCLMQAVVARQSLPLGLVYSLAGPVVSLGRYHLYGGAAERAGIGCYRRLTGGRVCGAGDGWFGCALILPERTTLLPAADARLKPEQVMNRFARGFLAALRSLGVEAFYPGRDAITVERRELAMCSFESNSTGATLFEILVAGNRGLEGTVHDLEALDPDGSLPFALWTPETSTTLSREANRDLTFDRFAQAIEAGYAAQLGSIDRRQLSASEMSAAEQRAATLADLGWLNSRRREPTLDHVARIAGQLGFVEAYLKLDASGQIERLLLAGDYIANSDAVAAFEKAACGRRPDLGSLSRIAAQVFDGMQNYILGIGELPNLVKLISKAL